MQAGDLVFVRTRGLIGNLVASVDPGKWSHVCIAVSATHVLTVDFFTRANILPLNEKEYEVVPSVLTDSQRISVQNVANSMIGVRYDTMLALYYLLRGVLKLKRPWNFAKARICSELVVGVLEAATGGFYPLCTPNELYSIVKKTVG